MIDLEKIKNHIPGYIGEAQMLNSAVCIPLIERAAGGIDILFEVRSDKIVDQPGDVCLPGGGAEASDKTPKDTVIREVCEELLIKPEQLEIIGEGDILRRPELTIYSFVGILRDYDGRFDEFEVAEVFTVPLSYFLETEPEGYIIRNIPTPEEGFPYELIAGGRDYKWRGRESKEYFYQYDGHVIWGLTARIIRAFIKILS